MRIIVKNKNERPHFLALFFPLWMVKLKVVSKGLAKNKDIALDADELHKTIKSAYREIKKYVRENGHFDLVKVDSHDGTHVRIRI